MRSNTARTNQGQGTTSARNYHIGQLRATAAGTTARLPPARASGNGGTIPDDNEQALHARATRYRRAAESRRESGTQSGESDSESESSSDMVVPPTQPSSGSSPLVLSPSTQRALSARGLEELTALGALVGGASGQRLELDLECDSLDTGRGTSGDENGAEVGGSSGAREKEEEKEEEDQDEEDDAQTRPRPRAEVAQQSKSARAPSPSTAPGASGLERAAKYPLPAPRRGDAGRTLHPARARRAPAPSAGTAGGLRLAPALSAGTTSGLRLVPAPSAVTSSVVRATRRYPASSRGAPGPAGAGVIAARNEGLAASPSSTSASPAVESTPSTPASSAGGRAREASVAVRKEKPNYELWTRDALKDEALRQAGRRGTLKFGTGEDDILRQISNAKKPKMMHALKARIEYLEALGEEPQWMHAPVGLTPEKKKADQQARVTKAKKKSGQRGKKAVISSEAQTYCCRLACLTFNADFFPLYLRSKGGGEGVGRSEQDEGALGKNHEFYKKIAVAMSTVNWRDSNGNSLSLPNDHSADERAPNTLVRALAALPAEMEKSAVALREELETVFEGDQEAFLYDLQGRSYNWIKGIRTFHTTYRHNENQSGGAGADPTSDGNFLDSSHPFNFMGGRLPTMIWEDGLQIMGEEGGTNFTGDTIIPDGGIGAGSSIRGGPGVRSTAERTTAKPSSGSGSSSASNPLPQPRRKRRQARDPEKQTLAEDTRALMQTMAAAAELELKNLQAEAADTNEKRVKDLADSVDVLHAKVAGAKTEQSREAFEMLLQDAMADLAEAMAARRKARAAAKGAAKAAAAAAATGGEEEEEEEEEEKEEEEDAGDLASTSVADRPVVARGVKSNPRSVSEALDEVGAGAAVVGTAPPSGDAMRWSTPIEALPAVARAVAGTDV